jgi:hypothetical protein
VLVSPGSWWECCMGVNIEETLLERGTERFDGNVFPPSSSIVIQLFGRFSSENYKHNYNMCV